MRQFIVLFLKNVRPFKPHECCHALRRISSLLDGVVANEARLDKVHTVDLIGHDTSVDMRSCTLGEAFCQLLPGLALHHHHLAVAQAM